MPIPLYNLFLLLLLINANLAHENCASDIVLQDRLNRDASIRAKRSTVEALIAAAQSGKPSYPTNISIPVVVHFVYHTADQNLDDSYAHSQIDVLNEDYSMSNADISSVISTFQSVEGSPRISFFLATKDPNGNPTSGITRTQTNVQGFSEDDRVKYTKYGGIDAWRTDKYLNIWVCNLQGYLGYAQFPLAGPRATEGVVINYSAFGRPGLNTKYGLGRTATHEIGHYFNLLHTWGNGNCATNDLVADTPASNVPHYQCDLAASSCGNLNMVQNFMDYAPDNCAVMFTQGQANRMLPMFSVGGPRYSLLFVNSYCDNGVVEDGEDCDDGNRIDGDGCSSSCTVETGYNCTTDSPSVCTAYCPVIFSDEFEGKELSWNNWVPFPFGWGTSQDDFTKGNSSLYVTDANTFSNYIIISQPIRFPGTGSMFLNFNLKIDTQVGDSNQCYDGLRLLTSSDKFATQSLLQSFTAPYSSTNQFTNSAVWCTYGSPELEPEWKYVSVDLSSLSGTISQIAFQFVSDGNIGGTGVYIDSLQIVWVSASCQESRTLGTVVDG